MIEEVLDEKQKSTSESNENNNVFESNENILNKPKKLTKPSKNIFRNIIRMYPIAVLALIDTLMVLVPTYMENYIPGLYQYIHIKNDDYSYGLAFYGFFSMFMNFLGTYIAGRFKGRTLILWSLFIQIFATLWYGSLMFQHDEKATFIEWIFILLVFSFAISGLIWGPMWRIVKNFNTEGLDEKEREMQVATNNGIEGTFEGIIGIIIGLTGTGLTALANSGVLGEVTFLGTKASVAFLILISLIVILTIASTVLTWALIKPIEYNAQKQFSVKTLSRVIKNWKVWALGFIVLGVFMLQSEMSAYVNYLRYTFLIAGTVVSVFGVIRTYVMRMLLARFVGKWADKMHSYVLFLVVGLAVGILFIVIAICLPWFSGNKNIGEEHYSKAVMIVMQVAALINLLILGGLTWCLVTIRWTPLGTELGVTNENYASAIALLSAIGFSPGLYFRYIKGYIEHNYSYTITSATGDTTKVASQTGNQLILLACAGIACIGLIAGIILYCSLYKNGKRRNFDSKLDSVAN